MKITLKDGSAKEYDRAMSVIEIAADISEGLARAACAGEINGERVDLRTIVDQDCTLNILTFNDKEGADAFRHTTSHIMAQAIKRLYPNAKLAIGPSIDDGFYYDIDNDTPLTTEDLEKMKSDIEAHLSQAASIGLSRDELLTILLNTEPYSKFDELRQSFQRGDS